MHACAAAFLPLQGAKFNTNCACIVLDCRLQDTVLRWLPVTHNKAVEPAAASEGDSPIKTVLRSKGFMWLSNKHTTAFYWSHAGWLVSMLFFN